MASDPDSRRSDARHNREQVLAAGVELLSRDPNLSMEEIADASGLGRTTVYRHFVCRDTLVEAVVEEVIARARVPAAAALTEESDTEEGLRDFISVIVDFVSDHGPLMSHREMGAATRERWRRSDESPTRRFLVSRRERGEIRNDMPLSWQMTVIQTVALEAAEEIRAGRVEPADAKRRAADSLVSILLPR